MTRFVSILSIMGVCMALLACNRTPLHPQTEPTSVDSLLQELKGAIAHHRDSLEHIEKVYTMIRREEPTPTHFNQLAYLLANNSRDSSYFFKASKAGLSLAKKQHDTLAMADAFWNYGIYYLKHHAYEKSYESYRKAFTLFTGKNPYYAGKMLYNMAYIRGRIKDYTGSEVLLFKAIALFEHEEKNKQLYFCYNHLGAIYDDLQEYTAALEAYHTAIGYLDKVDHPSIFYEDIHNNLGLLYQKIGEQEQAVSHFNQALEREQLHKIEPALYARLLDNRAYSNFLQDPNESVLHSMKTALHIRDSLNHPAGQLISHLHLARYYAAQKDTSTALQHAHKAYDLGKNMQLHRDALTALKLLATLTPKKRVAYLQHYIKLSDSVESEERHVRNKFTRIQYETERYIDANKQLERDQLWTLTAGIGVTLILLLLIIIFRQRSKNKVLVFESQQRKADEKIYLLTLKQQANLEKGRLEERRRISEDLHDGILGRLFGIRFHWEFLQLGGSKKTIIKHQEHLADLQQIETDIRQLSHDLKHDLFLSESQYIQSLYALLNTWAERGNFKYDFEVNSHTEWETLDDYIKVNLYRMLEEALHNITKHAAATAVTLTLQMHTNYCSVELTDDGCGFNTKYTGRGIGLKNIASRTQKIKGRFTLDSDPGAGTTLFITFPQSDNS